MFKTRHVSIILLAIFSFLWALPLVLDRVVFKCVPM